MSVEVKVPDIGDFEDVPVVEVLVQVGDEVAVEDPLVTLESDKASMEVPSSAAGTIEELRVSEGDTVSQGDVIAVLSSGDDAPASTDDDAVAQNAEADAAEATDADTADADDAGGERVDVVVVGSGPGGYTAAFRAADLGLSVVLVERYASLGGVCLNVGCIPSKALLHVAKVITDAEEASGLGVGFGTPDIDVDGVRKGKDDAVTTLTGGVAQMAKARGVRVVEGTAELTGPHELTVGDETIAFEHAILATGSTAAMLPDLPDDERIMDSTGALELADVPRRLLVVGGGIIGLEMACVYDALGSKVTVVELADALIPGCDSDLVKVLRRRIEARYDEIALEAKVDKIAARKDGLRVTFAGAREGTKTFDRILVAVGRKVDGAALGLDAAGVKVADDGTVPVDEQRRTNVDHIFAIGDLTGPPMLAHKATHEGKVAAEVIAGQSAAFDVRAIPSVAYTDPEVAWAGVTETTAKADGVDVEVSRFPWSASGRALSIHRADGLTKVLSDPESGRVLGVGIVGAGAGELIAEAALAIEMGADVEDVGLTVHPHPTLSETVAFAAEVGAGTVTDLPPKRKRR